MIRAKGVVTSMGPVGDDAGLFAGPGEVRERLRAVPWSRTPLGPVRVVVTGAADDAAGRVGVRFPDRDPLGAGIGWRCTTTRSCR